VKVERSKDWWLAKARQEGNSEVGAGGHPVCRACGKLFILPDNARIADGCPCNSLRGVNHGLVPRDVCTCVGCDPAQTGASRVREQTAKTVR
jgi:hypothetical protein